MSSSSMILIDENNKGYNYFEYKNSWLFSPVGWDVLLEKYMKNEIMLPGGGKRSLICDLTNSLHEKLNNIINNSEIFSDRIVWELTNQQIFFSKDKEKISKAITKFLIENKEFSKNRDEYLLKEGNNIYNRYLEIAEDILKIDEEKYPFFALKNSSCDDSVENWFYNYNDKTEEYENCSLNENLSDVAEFVLIDNEKIKFLSNIEFYKEKNTRKKVFLGGTYNESNWRMKVINNINIDYFNPVVDNWTEDCYLRELEERETCDYCLYVITPKMTGVYSIAEVIDDSNKRPDKTIFCFITKDGDNVFTKEQIKSLDKTGIMVKNNGGKYFNDLEQVIDYLNNKL